MLRFSSLGDIIMGTAMIRCLRTAFPDAQIDMVVRADFLDLIRFNPHLNQKIGLPRASGIKGVRNLLRQINHEQYDLIYDAHRSLRTLCMMPFLKARQKVYFKKNYVRRSLALTFKLPLLRNVTRMLIRYIEPLIPFGVRFDNRGPEIFIDEASRQSAKIKLGRALPAGSGPVVGLIPSAQWPGKRWPLPYFRTLLETLVRETPYPVIIFGGKEDSFCGPLVEGLPVDRILNTQGRLTIAESAAMVERCQLVVANDTGLMHVADALDIPCVVVLGPTSKEMGCLPFHRQSEIVEKSLWCRPCSKNGQGPCIRFGNRVCLNSIGPEAVFARVEQLVKRLA